MHRNKLTPRTRPLQCGTVLLSGLLLVAGCATPADRAGIAVTVSNPYATVDWSKWGQYKANLHTHTTRSDGKLQPGDVIREYHSRGYAILALTDHKRVTWPWTKYDANPEALGMVAVQGAELSAEAHLNSLFSDVLGTNADTVLPATAAQGGLVIFNHPIRGTRKDVAWFVTRYRQHPHFIGVESFNGGEQVVNGFPYWDYLLDELMPERPVWGFANDDTHRLEQVGRHWNVFPLPELTENAVRQAMECGRFYTASGPDTPTIHAITVNTNAGTITIRATPARLIRWIANGEVVHEGPTFNYRKLAGSPAHTYVRADIFAPFGGRAQTNPFGLHRQGVAPPLTAEERLARWDALRHDRAQMLVAEQTANWKAAYPLASRTPQQAWRELDLIPFVNRGLRGPDAWIARTHELTLLSPGQHHIHGVPFRVLNQRSHDGRACIALRSRSLLVSAGKPLPDSASVPVNARVRALYVLHGAGFVIRHEPAGEYALVYADGSTASVEIVGLGHEPRNPRELRRDTRRSNIQDWWPLYPQIEQHRQARKVVIVGDGMTGEVRYLYTLEFRNPHPDRIVKEVRFQSRPEVDTLLLILAATVATVP